MPSYITERTIKAERTAEAQAITDSIELLESLPLYRQDDDDATPTCDMGCA